MFADLLQLVETTCSKPVDNNQLAKSLLRKCNQTLQAMPRHPDIGLLIKSLQEFNKLAATHAFLAVKS